MADYDASQAGSNNAATGPIARPDVDSLPAGSMGPASGNTITGTGTVTGQSGADTPGPGGASVVEVHGAGGATSGGNGNFQATGQYGVLSMDAQGDYNYVRNPGTPDGVRDVFQYTLADAQGAHSATTLTIDIGQVLTANAGIVNLPAGVELSDIHVVGRDLVIDMPDGTHMVIPNGAVFVPELSIGDVAVPATNVAALLIDSEPQPAAGNTPSSGGDFADPVPPLDPGIPLGDLIPPTELTYNPPEFKPEGQFIDRHPTIEIQPDGQPATVAAVDSVDEKGLPTRNGGEPAGSGEIADGDGSNNSDQSETTAGTIIIDSPDGVGSVMINGVLVTGQAGQQIAGEFGTLTITGFSGANILYTYTLNDNTNANTQTHDDFSVTVTDPDGDQATATLTIDIVDDHPTARNDTDSTDNQTHVATGNVMTGADTTSGSSGHDTVGADDAHVTSVTGYNGSADTSLDSSNNLQVTGHYGTLVLNADGSYTYTLNSDAPGGSVDVFTYTLTDGDGSTSTATLTITNPDHTPTLDVPTAGQAGTVVDEAGLPPHDGLPAGSGEIANGDPNDNSDTSETTNGTIHFTQGDAPAVVTIDGVAVTGTPGQQFVGDHGILTITGYNAGTGTITYSYTLTESTSGNNTSDSFAIAVTDVDGDHANSTLTINIIDDVPTAHNDTDALEGSNMTTDGNVITTVGTTDPAGTGVDVQGADGAHITAIQGAGGTDTTFENGLLSIHGSHGTLTIDADGNYTYTRDPGFTGAATDTFTYTLTDGDGDPSTATLTITLPNINQAPTAEGDTTYVSEEVLPSVGTERGGDDDGDSAHDVVTNSGDIHAVDPDGDPMTITLTAPSGTYTSGGTTITWELSNGGHTLTGTAGSTTVLVATIDNTGQYTVTLSAPIDTPNGGIGENGGDSVITIGVNVSDGQLSTPTTIVVHVEDDAPIAAADTNSTAAGTTLTVLVGSASNVLHNDVSGADGYASGGGVVGVRLAGGDTTTPVTTGVGTVIHGTYGDLTLYADGHYTYQAKPNTTGTDHFVYTIQDGDGDKSTTTLDITVGAVTAAVGTGSTVVSEEVLPLVGTERGGDTDSDPTHDVLTNSGTITLSDSIVGATFTTALTIPSGTYSSGGTTITWALSNGGHTLTGTAGTTTVLVATIDNSGHYTVTLSAPIDTPNGVNAGENGGDSIITIGVTATDNFGNTLTSGSLTVNVEDDAPTLGTIQPITSDNNPTDTNSTIHDGQGSLHLAMGADGFKSVDISVTLAGITSGGHALVGHQVGNVYTAYIDANGNGSYDSGDTSAVFTITVDPNGGTTGTYTFDLLQALDGTTVPVQIGGSSSFGAGPTLGQTLQNTGGTEDLSVVSGYHTTGSFNFATWFGGTLGTSDVTSAGVNGSTAGWGIDDNNFSTNHNGQEVMYFDFGAQALSDPDGSGSFVPPGSVTLPNITYATFDFINYKSGAGNAGDDIAYVVHFTDGTSAHGFIPDASIDGAPWTFTAPSGKFIADIQFYSGANPDGSAQDLSPGKVDLVEVGTQSTNVDVTIPVSMTFTDGDNDTVTGSTSIHVTNSGTATTPNAVVNTTMATNSVSTNTSLSSDHLVAPNDNHRSFEEHRSANTAALLGAVAAAGLSSAQQVAAEGLNLHGMVHPLHSGPIMAPDMLPNTQFAVRDSGSGASVQPTHIVAPDHVGGSAHLSSQANAAAIHGLVGQDHGGHHAVTQLLGGTDSHAMSHGPAPLTSAAVAIPPAQFLAAHMGAGKGGVEGAPNATTVIHSDGAVGKVLTDALAGGHGHGPNIDALLHHAAGHGHGSANDALASLASHDAAGVSNGHSGVFAGFHGAPVMEHMMMHQDAVPAHS